MTNQNTYSAYRVLVPYTCCVTLPNDGHMTKITIETTSQVVRYGQNKDDISQQMEIDNSHGKSIYANHILNRYFPDSIRIVANRRRTRPPMEGISLCGHSAAPIW